MSILLDAEEEARRWVKKALIKIEKNTLGGSGMYLQTTGMGCIMDPRVLPAFCFWMFGMCADSSDIFITSTTTSTSTGAGSGGSGATSLPVVSITAMNAVAIMALFLSVMVATEFFVSGTGSVKQAYGKTIQRPSSWASIGKARGSFDIALTPYLDAGGGFLNESVLRSSRAIGCFDGVKGVLNSLPTAAKLRAQCLSSGVGHCFCIVYLAGCSIKFGRVAEKKAGPTRASAAPQDGVRLSRRAYKELKQGPNFNGIAGAIPEIALSTLALLEFMIVAT